MRPPSYRPITDRTGANDTIFHLNVSTISNLILLLTVWHFYRKLYKNKLALMIINGLLTHNFPTTIEALEIKDVQMKFKPWEIRVV